jgi:hypothetical protein
MAIQTKTVGSDYFEFIYRIHAQQQLQLLQEVSCSVSAGPPAAGSILDQRFWTHNTTEGIESSQKMDKQNAVPG